MTFNFLGRNPGLKMSRVGILLLAISLIHGCAVFKSRDPGIGEAVDWAEIAGWEDDKLAEVWPAVLSNCQAKKPIPGWQAACKNVLTMENPDSAQTRAFFEKWFVPHRLYGKGGKPSGLVTGYYEPLLYGSFTPDSRFRWPVYSVPDSLVIIDLGDLYPELENRRVRGRLEGNRVVPFYSRREIESDRSLLAGHELLWLDDRDAVFFLHIQGSGRVELPDGSTLGVGYSNQNGHPYVAIGRILLDQGELSRDEISLFTIRQWLDDNPDKADELLFANPSYVFFTLREEVANGPIGSLNVPLTAQRSIAIDPKVVALGTPIWLQTNVPGNPETPYHRLVIAQDTGGAIKGPLRADLFWGHGEEAERNAGIMKEQGTMVVLLPRE